MKATRTTSKPADALTKGDSFSPWPWTQSYTCLATREGASRRWLLVSCTKDGTGEHVTLTLASGEVVNTEVPR